MAQCLSCKEAPPGRRLNVHAKAVSETAVGDRGPHTLRIDAVRMRCARLVSLVGPVEAGLRAASGLTVAPCCTAVDEARTARSMESPLLAPSESLSLSSVDPAGDAATGVTASVLS